nr:metallophosphoesterase [Methylosinus sp. PW1]
MKILVLSDLHIEHGYQWSMPENLPPHDVVVLAGDIHSPPNSAVEWAKMEFFPAAVVYVAGNHEFYGGSIQARVFAGAEAAKGTNVHLLDRGRVVINGVRFLGATLWTNYDLFGRRDEAMAEAGRWLNDHRLINGFTPTLAHELHVIDLCFLEARLKERFDGPTVVVTHHAPHPDSVAPQFTNDPLTPAFASDLTWLIEKYRPALWIHGHMHSSFDYRVGETRVICNPKGYGPHSFRGLPENTEFGMLVVEVDA